MDLLNHLIENLIQSPAITESRETQAYHVLTRLHNYQTLKSTVHSLASDYLGHHRKNIANARDWYIDGHIELSAGNYEKAISLFTMSIRSCPFPDDAVPDDEEDEETQSTNLLANCYRKRWQAFQQLGDYENACYDRNQYKYLTNTEEEVVGDSDEDIDEWIEIIDREMTRIETRVHESVVLETDQIKGRYLAASERIRTETVILTERPVSSVLYHQYFKSHCGHCFRRVDNQFWPCRTCDEVVFCGLRCAELAAIQFHRHECGVAGLLAQYNPSAHLAYRLLSRVGCETAVELSGETSGGDITESWIVDSDRNCVEFGDAYKAFVTLFDHLESLSPRIASQSLVLSVFMAFFLQFMGVFTHSGDDLPAFVAFVLLIQSHISKIDVNSFEYKADDGVTRLGMAVMYLGSIFSHSCRPNVNFMWENGYLFCWTVTDIEAGDELFVSYGPVYGNASVKERRKKLQDNYHFRCECGSCVEEDARLKGLMCRQCGDGVVDYSESTKQGKCLSCGESYPNLENVLSRIASIKSEIQTLLISIENNIDVELRVRQIDALLDEMSEYLLESSEGITDTMENIARICETIKRYDLVVKYRRQLFPYELKVEQYSEESLKQLVKLMDSYVRYINDFNIVDREDWEFCLCLMELIVEIIDYMLTKMLGYEERERLNELLVGITRMRDEFTKSMRNLP